MKSIQQFLQKPWLYVIILVIGLSLKLYRIDYRFFSFDEVCTIGQTVNDYLFNAPENAIKNIGYYKDQLHAGNHNISFVEQLKRKSKSLDLNPLHYAFLMVWYRIVGDAPIHYRLFSVLVFILTLPFLFLLAKELFKTNLAGWIAISLFCVSPLIHYYAHEARYHMLLTFLLIVCHYLLIKAIKHQKIKWWIGYSIVGILALYASIMSGVVIIGHFIYIMIFKKKLRIPFIINASIILLAYLPWLVFLINKREEIISALSWHTWYGQNQNFWKLFIFQLMDLSHFFMSFIDFLHYRNLPLFNDFHGIYFELASNIIVLMVIIYAVIYVFRKSPKEVFYLLAVIFLPYYLFIYISDLVRGAGQSLYWRYHDIYYIGIFLFMTGFLTLKTLQRKLAWSAIYIGLITVGLVSILININDKCWDTFQYCEEHVKKAQLISNLKQPLLITDGPGIESIKFMTMINACESENIDILRASHDIKNIEEILTDKNYSEIYVTHASNELVENLKSQFGERMDSSEIKGISPMWQIRY